MQRDDKNNTAASIAPLGAAFAIGTRGSPLALWQAEWVRGQLIEAHGWDDGYVQIKVIKTSGDRLKGALADFGGKGLFTRELEDALVDGRIDIAVHSMKDVPTQARPELTIGAVLERADMRDGFISASGITLENMPQNAVIGTASIRRRAQLARLRPDLKFSLLRGNVGTRLEKLAHGECAATLLACAGLKRLGQEDVITEIIETDRMLPAPAQGAVGVELREDNTHAKAALVSLNHGPTQLAVTAERAFLKALDGSCRTPIAALATLDGEQMHLRGEVLSLDGAQKFTRQETAKVSSLVQAYARGFAMGEAIKSEIGPKNLWNS